MAVVILTVGGMSMSTPAGASKTPSQSGPVTTVTLALGRAKPVVPKVHATYTLNPKAVLISSKDVRFETSKRDIPQQLTYVGTKLIGVASIIVVSTTTGPFYGKVAAISGQLVTTKPATLGEIFKVLNLTMSTPTGSASSRSPATGAVTKSQAAGTSTRAQRAIKSRASAPGESAPSPSPIASPAKPTWTSSPAAQPPSTLATTQRRCWGRPNPMAARGTSCTPARSPRR